MALARRLALLGASLAALTALFIYRARVGLGCGPFFPYPAFTFRNRPDPPFEEFARGRLGIIQPTYSPLYLYVAYRDLAGVGFNASETKTLFPNPTEIPPVQQARSQEWLSAGEPWVLEWFDARKLVPGVDQPPKMRVYKWLTMSQGNNQYYVQFLNCTEDAFRTAAATLRRRVEKFGASSAEVKDWVKAQDRVFANCSGGIEDPWISVQKGAGSAPPVLVIPVAASAAAPTLLRADRAYQIAAANFYAGNYDAARQMFEEIARDPASPWSGLASYLAARALVRKATVVGESGAFNRDTLAEAEARLRKIMADPGLGQIHPAAERLLSYVQIRLHPEDRFHVLAEALLRPKSEKDLPQDVVDFRYLLRKMGWAYRAQVLGPGPGERPHAPIPRADLTDWITAFGSDNPRALEVALEKWRATQSQAWLVASLAKVTPDHPAAPELLKAAEAVGKSSPAYPSVSYHATRLLVESGQAEEGRVRLGNLIALGHSFFPPSSMNLLLAMRMKLARALGEFLKYAPRVPAGYSVEFDEMEGAEGPKNGAVLFDVDAANVLNTQMPLALLKRAAETKTLPANLRREIALAAWVRSVLLNDDAMARGLVPTAAAVVPELKSDLEAYVKAETAGARKFAAALLMLRFPGVQPYVTAGRQRETPLGRIDNYRENWWAAGAPCALYWRYLPSVPEKGPRRKTPPAVSFLSETEKQTAEVEWQKLLNVDMGPDYLSQAVMEWAKRRPDDPRVPEALYHAVRATRYGCTDEKTPELSKAAFQILHQRYPKTSWARMTKYWYE